jgi:hypothetical protein
MRVLFASSEIYPLAKTGGLADVAASLPLALAELGVEISLLMPGYPQAIASATKKSVVVEIPDLAGAGMTRLIAARVPDTDLPLWLVDCPTLFDRPGGLYQDERGLDWPDNAQRFALFSRVAALLSASDLVPEWRADLVHANDWHTGLVPAYLEARPDKGPATLFTIHNLAYQGQFSGSVFPGLELPAEIFTADGIEFYGGVSFLKAGIRYCDQLTTVSPSYAQEIMTPEFGCGLDGLLRRRASQICGILNGVDYRLWNPTRDPHLPATFTRRDLSGKRRCKEALQAELGLASPTHRLLRTSVASRTRKWPTRCSMRCPRSSIEARGSRFSAKAIPRLKVASETRRNAIRENLQCASGMKNPSSTDFMRAPIYCSTPRGSSLVVWRRFMPCDTARCRSCATSADLPTLSRMPMKTPSASAPRRDLPFASQPHRRCSPASIALSPSMPSRLPGGRCSMRQWIRTSVGKLRHGTISPFTAGWHPRPSSSMSRNRSNLGSRRLRNRTPRGREDLGSVFTRRNALLL